MWTHHFTFDVLEPEVGTTPEALLASYNDEEEREFAVMFFLEDVRLQRNETCLLVKEDTPFTIQGGVIKGIFGANERGRLNRIALVLRDKHPQQAIWLSQRVISYFLSNWTLIFGSAIRAFGMRILDHKHHVSARSFPDVGAHDDVSSTPLSVPPSLDLSKKHLKMISLYREARNSQSPYYALLCAFKVMEGVLKYGIFTGTDDTLEVLGIDAHRKPGIITSRMLEISRTAARFKGYEGKRFGPFMKAIRPLRNKVAHAIERAGDMFDFDSPQDRIEVSLHASLSDLVARFLLIEELRLLHTIQHFRKTGCEPQDERYNYDVCLLSTTIHPVNEPVERWLETRESKVEDGDDEA